MFSRLFGRRLIILSYEPAFFFFCVYANRIKPKWNVNFLFLKNFYLHETSLERFHPFASGRTSPVTRSVASRGDAGRCFHATATNLFLAGSSACACADWYPKSWCVSGSGLFQPHVFASIKPPVPLLGQQRAICNKHCSLIVTRYFPTHNRHTHTPGTVMRSERASVIRKTRWALCCCVMCGCYGKSTRPSSECIFEFSESKVFRCSGQSI